MRRTNDMKESVTKQADSPFDLVALLEQVDNDRELLRDLVAIF